MAKKPKPEGKKYSYMDTYGDLVTLLLCFFVLLFSMSSVEEQKYNAIVEAFSQQFGQVPTNISFVPADTSVESGSEIGAETPTGMEIDPDVTLPSDLAQLKETIQKFVEEHDMAGKVEVEEGASGAVFLRLSANLLFAGDSYDLSGDATEFLDYFSECLNSIETEIMQVKFNGHTGDIAGSSTDDWKLSAERAGLVSSYVEKVGGFNRFKIAPDFYGRNYPIADNGTPEGLAQNRRVDIIVLGNNTGNLEATMMDAMRMYFPGDDTSFFEGDPSDLPDTIIDQSITQVAEGEKLLDNLTSEQIKNLVDDAQSMAEENGFPPDAASSPSDETPAGASGAASSAASNEAPASSAASSGG